MDNLVSIIMPVFNAERYASAAIQSVLDQDFHHWELIIINDGSTDNSAKAIKEFKDHRIKYIEQANRGVSTARNAGLKQMKGNYFCFLDADDRFTPQSLSSRLELFNRNPMVTFVDGRIEIYNSTFETKISERIQFFEGPPLSALCKIDENVFFGPTWMIRKEKGKQYRFDEKLTHGEDLFFYLSIALHGYYMATDQSIYQYRRSDYSAMSNETALFDGYGKILLKLQEVPGIRPDDIRNFRNRICGIAIRTFVKKFSLIRLFKYLRYFWSLPIKGSQK